MLGYRTGVKRCCGEEIGFLNWIRSGSKVEVVFDTACHGGIGSFYDFLLGGVN